MDASLRKYRAMESVGLRSTMHMNLQTDPSSENFNEWLSREVQSNSYMYDYVSTDVIPFLEIDSS